MSYEIIRVYFCLCVFPLSVWSGFDLCVSTEYLTLCYLEIVLAHKTSSYSAVFDVNVVSCELLALLQLCNIFQTTYYHFRQLLSI